MKLTKKQKNTYIKKGGVGCPSCGSEDIEGGAVEIDAGICSQGVHCLSCNGQWTDTYTLTGVEERK